MSMRFKSVLHPDKWGYEYTGDSMTFWDTSYRHGGVMHGALGYYETLGDGTTQHSMLRACGVHQFTDCLISLVQHITENIVDVLAAESLNCHLAYEPSLSRCDPEFLASIKYREDKKQWFNKSERKVTTSKSKQYDKRWIEVPTWADGTIASAVTLFGWDGECSYKSCRERELLPLYLLHDHFDRALYGKVDQGYTEWNKMVEYRKTIPGDHHSAVQAFQSAMKGVESIRYAGRALSCAIHNSRINEESVVQVNPAKEAKAEEVAA